MTSIQQSIPSPSPSLATPSTPAALLAEIQAVFAQVTRYPLEILEPDADLEEELGIDSVKLGEVVAALRHRYDLPADATLAKEDVGSIAAIARGLEKTLRPRRPASDEIAIAAPTVVHSVPSSAATPATAPRERPFAGRVALITGSGRGLGQAIASHLAELGATVVVNSFHSRDRGIATAEEIQARGDQALHLWGSVANPEQLGGMFREIDERFGGLDFFVSNASNGLLARLEDIAPDHWEKAFRTNVVGLHQGALHAARLMKKRGGGKIITLSSPAAHGYVEYFGCMGAVKAAVESLTRSLAIELAPQGISVNCVSPGPVRGELLDKWPDKERLVPQWAASTPSGRLCEGRDVAEFIAYLLGERARFFTGSVLVMDGGISSQGW